jgi:hypothetical protein
MMTRTPRRENLIPVNNPNEIPAFETEAEEHKYWKTHELGLGMFENVEPDPLLEQIPTRPRTERTRPVPVRFDADTLRCLRTLAARNGTGYQTLLKTFVMERLYKQEKRQGIIGG